MEGDHFRHLAKPDINVGFQFCPATAFCPGFPMYDNHAPKAPCPAVLNKSIKLRACFFSILTVQIKALLLSLGFWSGILPSERLSIMNFSSAAVAAARLVSVLISFFFGVFRSTLSLLIGFTPFIAEWKRSISLRSSSGRRLSGWKVLLMVLARHS